MVAGQDDDRLAQARELGPHEVDGLVRHAVMVEEVARDQEQIDPIAQRPIDDALEDAPSALLMRGLLTPVTVAVALEMHVGRVQHSQGASGQGHALQHAIFPARPSPGLTVRAASA